MRAIVNRDLGEFAATICDDVRLVGTDGRILETAAEAVAAHRAWFADATWRFDAADRVLTQSRGQAGWALIRVRYDDAGNVRRFNLFLLFTLEPDGEWKLAYDQGTTILS